MTNYKKHYPTSRKRWTNAAIPRGIDTKGMMNRFHTRYALAYGFKDVVIDGYSDVAMRGYAALMKIDLVYSALDMLIKASHAITLPLEKLTKEKSNITHVNLELSERLKRYPELAIFLMKTTSNKVYVRKIHLLVGDNPLIQDDPELLKILKTAEKQEVDFIEGDVFCVAAAVRHGVAHGNISVYAAALEKKKNVRLLKDLSKEILKFIDDEFTKLTEQLEATAIPLSFEQSPS